MLKEQIECVFAGKNDIILTVYTILTQIVDSFGTADGQRMKLNCLINVSLH